jgi:hypothetical protein
MRQWELYGITDGQEAEAEPAERRTGGARAPAVLLVERFGDDRQPTPDGLVDH